MNETPKSYKPSTWRNTLRLDKERHIGIGFNTPDEIVRLCIDAESAKHLIETLAEEIKSL